MIVRKVLWKCSKTILFILWLKVLDSENKNRTENECIKDEII